MREVWFIADRLHPPPRRSEVGLSAVEKPAGDHGDGLAGPPVSDVVLTSAGIASSAGYPMIPRGSVDPLRCTGLESRVGRSFLRHPTAPGERQYRAGGLVGAHE